MSATGHGGLGGATMQLRATVVEYEDAPDECTIFPRRVSGIERMTTWISAEESSYVDLESIR
jgi:hypothetical protein